MKKKIQKNAPKKSKMLNFEKKRPIEMLDKHLSTKFGVNLLGGFRGNRFYYGQMTDGRTTDARAMSAALRCSSTRRQPFGILQ